MKNKAEKKISKVMREYKAGGLQSKIQNRQLLLRCQKLGKLRKNEN